MLWGLVIYYLQGQDIYFEKDSKFILVFYIHVLKLTPTHIAVCNKCRLQTCRLAGKPGSHYCEIL